MEEEKQIFGQIYAIIDPFPEQLGGRVQYIGKHQLGKNENNLQESLEKYLTKNISGAKSNIETLRPHNVYLRNEIKDCLGNLYVRPKIEQVEVCYSLDELNHREEYWRKFFLGFYPDLLNRALGGAGGTFVGHGKGSHSGERNGMFGKSIFDFMTKEAIQLWKQHESEANSGTKNPMFGKSAKDMMTSEEWEKVNKKKSESNKIAQNRLERKQQLHDQMSGENNPRSKLTNVQVEEIKIKWLSGSYTRKQLYEEYNVVKPQRIKQIIRSSKVRN